MALQSGTYAIDTTHSTVGFVVRHMMITKVNGYFRDFEATVNIDAENLENSSAEGVVKVASVDTANEERDKHLETEDFFDATNYPEMTLKTTKVEAKSDSKAVVTADLTIKGNTKPVEFDVEIDGFAEDPWGNTRVGFTASATIDRTEFGIDFNAPLKTGGALLSNDIKLEIEASAIKQ